MSAQAGNGASPVRFADTAGACREGQAGVSLEGCVRQGRWPAVVPRQSPYRITTDPKHRLALATVSAKRTLMERFRPFPAAHDGPLFAPPIQPQA